MQRIEEVVTSKEIRRLKMLPKNLFEELEEINLFTLKFHMFDNIVNEVSRIGALNFSHTSLFEHSSYVIKRFIKMTSMRHGNTLEEAVNMTKSSVAIEEKKM